MRPSLALRAAALLVLPLLAGCDTLGALGPPDASATAAASPTLVVARHVDYTHDDVSKMIFAVDLPAGVQPLSSGTAALYEITTPSAGGRHIHAELALADGGEIDTTLPPPAPGRAYYLFGFADRDKLSVTQAEQWLATLPSGQTPKIAFQVVPKVCTSAAVDPATTTFTVTAVLPGGPPLQPIMANIPLKALPDKVGACA